jgi:ACS family hexuronate transporter-like MFS transporter
MTYLAGGLFSALPFLAADLGNLVGGFSSRELAQRGVETTRARLIVMTVCALLISCGAVIGRIPVGSGDALVLTLLGLMALGAAAFMANYFAFCQEVAPSHTGLIVGYLGGLGNLLAAGFYPVVGRIKDQTGDFRLVFLIVGLLPFLGLAALALGWRSRLDPPESA